MRWTPLVLVLLGCTPTAGPNESEPESEPERIPKSGTKPDPAPEPAIDRRNHTIAVGQYHSCVIRTGAVYCWGANSMGQLGDRSEIDRARPVPVIGIDNAISIAAGPEHTCALLEDRTVWCWGANPDGQVGPGPRTARTSAEQVPNIVGATAIAAGRTASCAVDGSARVRCWGKLDWEGQPLAIDTLVDAVDVGIGDTAVCALDRHGKVGCRGPNDYGEVGVLDPNIHASEVAGLGAAEQLAIGGTHGCAGLPPDAIACWGSGGSGKTGTAFANAVSYKQTNTTVAINSPGLAKLPPIVQVSAGTFHTCVVTRDGQVGCFGANRDGQAHPGLIDEGTPELRLVAGIDDAIEVAAGIWHTCVVQRSQAVMCWGDDARGQLGSGSQREAMRAVGLVEHENDYSGIALTGLEDRPCTTTLAGSVACSKPGELPVFEGQPIAQIDGARVLLESGAVFSRRPEIEGDEFGKRGSKTHPYVIDLEGLAVARLGRGYSPLTAVLDDGALAVSDMGTLKRVVDPAVASGVRTAVSTRNGVCLLDAAGVPWCWDLWAAAPPESKRPSKIEGVAGATALAGTWEQGCALLELGDVKCWSLDGPTPGPASVMPGLPPATMIVGMERHTCTLSDSGEVWCWGRNFNGELGDGTTGDRNEPVRVKGIPAVVSIEGDDEWTCARTEAHSLWCWGLSPLTRSSQDQLRASVGAGQTRVATVVGLPG